MWVQVKGSVRVGARVCGCASVRVCGCGCAALRVTLCLGRMSCRWPLPCCLRILVALILAEAGDSCLPVFLLGVRVGGEG